MFNEGLNGLEDLEVFHDKLYLAGYFHEPNSPGNMICSWDGEKWGRLSSGAVNIIGGGSVYRIKSHRDKLFAVGTFDSLGGLATHHFGIWDGHKWCTLDTSNTLENTILVDIGFIEDSIYISPGNVFGNGERANNFAVWKGYSRSIEYCEDTTTLSLELSPQSSSGFDYKASFIYPNQINLKLLSKPKIERSEIFIMNSMGEIIYQKEHVLAVNSKLFIDSLKPGLYVVSVKGQKRKIIVY
jgi:hypothetical protein